MPVGRHWPVLMMWTYLHVHPTRSPLRLFYALASIISNLQLPGRLLYSKLLTNSEQSAAALRGKGCNHHDRRVGPVPGPGARARAVTLKLKNQNGC
jgi:hypothetical protein